MELLIAWLVAGVAVGALAAGRNRSGFAWFLLAVALSPLLAGLLLFALRRGDAGTVAYTAQTHRNCPECREIVRADARLCKNCGSKLAPLM